MTKKESPMIGIADWLAKSSRIDQAQEVLKTVQKSKKSTEDDKVVADKMTKDLKLKSREKVAEEVKKLVVLRKTSELTPHPEIERVMVIKAEDYNRIKDDIDERGVTVPIVVDDEDKVICGITRWKACEELGIEDVPVFQGKFDTYQDLLDYAVRDNVMRRQLPTDERIALAASLLREKGQTKPGRPPESTDAVAKKVDKILTKPIQKATKEVEKKIKEVSKTIDKSYQLVVGKDNQRDTSFPKDVGSEVTKQIELLKVKGHTIIVYVKYEVKTNV